jgi:hypothetical protein
MLLLDFPLRENTTLTRPPSRQVALQPANYPANYGLLEQVKAVKMRTIPVIFFTC